MNQLAELPKEILKNILEHTCASLIDMKAICCTCHEFDYFKNFYYMSCVNFSLSEFPKWNYGYLSRVKFKTLNGIKYGPRFDILFSHNNQPPKLMLYKYYNNNTIFNDTFQVSLYFSDLLYLNKEMFLDGFDLKNMHGGILNDFYKDAMTRDPVGASFISQSQVNLGCYDKNFLIRETLPDPINICLSKYLKA
jgi:hypothetical protein